MGPVVSSPRVRYRRGVARRELALDLLALALSERERPLALTSILQALDRLTTRRPEDADAHYAAGRVLLLLGRAQLAMGAFRVVTRLRPDYVDAHYYEAVAHSLIGYPDEALEKLYRVTELDPAHADATFDQGQLFLARGDLVAALERFDAADALTPGDFAIARKRLQCLLGLDRFAEAATAREALRAAWEASSDPRVRATKSVVIDQFRVGELKVSAVETLAPTGDPAVLMSFVASDRGRAIFSVNLETSELLRRQGRLAVVAVRDRDTHSTTEHAYREMPGYNILRVAVRSVVRRFSAARRR